MRNHVAGHRKADLGKIVRIRDNDRRRWHVEAVEQNRCR